MRTDDLVYTLGLMTSVVAGTIIRRVHNQSQRKLLCTGFGVLLVFLVSKLHMLHCLATVGLGAASLKYVHPRKCHILTFFLIFGYLAFFRLGHIIGFPQPPNLTNMIQMILTLKVVGIAFEKTSSWEKLEQRKGQIARIENGSWMNAESGEALTEISEFDIELQSIGFWELFHYSFNYIGVLTGPYYRYRTYRDYFEMSFKNCAPYAAITKRKFGEVLLYCSLYLIAGYYWPLRYMLSAEFYVQRSVFYRLMYIWPTFFIFRMRMYVGLILSECVCTTAGFGAYPDEADVNNGEGPKTIQYMRLKRNLKTLTYNFTTIVNIRVKDVETSTTFREAMRHWNICVQYWMAVNIYQRFPNKKFRTAATLLCSAFWHGFNAGHYFCILGAAFYVPVEDIWIKLVPLTCSSIKRKVINALFWFFAFFAYGYLCVAFVLGSFHDIWKFYSSVHHIGYITWAFMLILGIILTKLQDALNKSFCRTRAMNHKGDDVYKTKSD